VWDSAYAGRDTINDVPSLKIKEKLRIVN